MVFTFLDTEGFLVEYSESGQAHVHREGRVTIVVF